ncbi:MAG TPA: gliding motility-associated C-terminal domain-containing protein [Pedobacter sp.]|uniref:T9SS type B sorting domain-containing protein n=1 Tax=Pedobacter sp. TaxID=1411316 RepID=UPI002B53E233|nr:gliding motility-associated C-terminal domain-containing protein [Pedobacter sp.]HMI03380.1 gliding motility-associated C-terminal domain-containing protein [Pedobacter sp.]
MKLTFTKQLKMPLLAFVFLLMGVLHAQAQFVHPGILFNAAGLARIKKDATTERQPWAATYAKMLAYNDINYVQKRVYADVRRQSGEDISDASNALSSQSQIAYRCAILWTITGNPQYATISKKILKNWSDTLRTFSGNGAKLAASWFGFGFVNAAEILRYTNSGWSAADILKAEGMFRNVFFPVIEHFQVGPAGNWSAAISKTMMAIGVFINDRGIYNRGLSFLKAKPGDGTAYDTFSGTLYNYISGTTGQCYESGRDQNHTQMGIGALAEACEMGYNQKETEDLFGLYSNRLLLGTEYTAEYNLGYSVPYTPNYYGDVISPDERGEFLPFYELVYNHYVNRKGMSGTPVKFTTMVVEKIRQDKGGESGMAILLGYGSFLFNEYAGFKYVPAAGDYRTTGLSSSMGTPAQFEVFTNGNWVPATTAIGAETNLLVRNGQSAVVAGNRNLKNLIVGEGNGAVLRAKINANAVSALTIVEPGNLSTIPALSFVNGGQATGSTSAVATITKVKVTGADINNQGSGYTSASVTFSGGGGSGAVATPTLSGGKIVNIVITDSGSNYTSIPTMSIIGNGTGAAVSAKVGITEVSIGSGGTGYTIAPTVIAGTFLKVSDGIALSVSTDVFFQRGSSVYTGGASTGILNIRGNLIAEDTVNCISVAHDNTMSSLTVNFTSGSDNIGFMGGNVTFNALGVTAGNTHKLKLGAVMNIAGAITLNGTGIIDATNGTIGFVNVSPSTSTLRTVAANTFKDATLNKMIVNSTNGVTLNQVLTIGKLDMQKGLLNIPETSEVTVSSVSGGSNTSYINTKSSASSSAIAKVKVTGLTTAQGDIPLGNGGNYLPVRITPPSETAFNFTMSVLTGLTANGLPNGGVVADKSQFVNASYHVIRTSGEGDYTFRVGFPASLKGSGFTPSSPFGISKYNGSSWLPVTGSGDYVLNTATATFDTNGLRHRVQIGGALPLNFVTATNASGSTESKATNLIVQEDFAKVKATNIMSPNGDGINDKWVIDNIDLYPNNEVKVFDKAGRFIYGKKGYDNSWEGTLNGVPLAEGTYYYIIDFGTSRLRFRGFITITRPE